MSKQNAAISEPATKGDAEYRHEHPCALHLRVLDADRGIVAYPEGQRRRKRIAICGFASSTRKYIIQAAGEPEWELWGLNQLYRHIPRADRWFDIHHNWLEETVPGTDHFKWAQECGIPFYTLARHAELPTNVRYPLQAVLDVYKTDYFTSTIPYMLAVAMLEIDAEVMRQTREFLRTIRSGEELDAIHMSDVIRSFYGEWTVALFGIDLVVGGEYFHEKPCAEFWLGMLAARGIAVAIPPESALCKQIVRYGSAPQADQLITPKEIGDHFAHLRSQRDEKLKELYMLEGAMQADERWEQVITLRQRGAEVR